VPNNRIRFPRKRRFVQDRRNYRNRLKSAKFILQGNVKISREERTSSISIGCKT